MNDWEIQIPEPIASWCFHCGLKLQCSKCGSRLSGGSRECIPDGVFIDCKQCGTRNKICDCTGFNIKI